MIIFNEIDSYKKDFKGLMKKYKTLKEDIDVVKKVLDILPDARPSFSFRIDNLGIESYVIKIKKIACKSLKGKGVNSGLRLVYTYFKEENKIVFIEIYHKNDKENEDRDRIINYLNGNFNN
jgi:mRNA-degrading endonuclease YafQ of YafQ-DinJ toxin-antitoxin module